MVNNKHTVLLCILDGWGYSTTTNCNAILQANKPVWDKLWHDYPHTLLLTHGAHVGLPSTQMGNSEVGHTNIGAGRVVYQESTRISRSVRTKSFFSNHTLVHPIETAYKNHQAVHIMGLLSDGGVHSHISHIKAIIELAHQQGIKKIFLHAFLDGRDTPPKSAEKYLLEIEDLFDNLGVGKIATIIGRYFALDRDKRWDRVNKAYHLIVNAEGDYQYDTATKALSQAYERDETDEFVSASVVGTKQKIKDGDVVFFMNFRSDRARELTESMILDDFTGFHRDYYPKIQNFITLTKFKDGYPADIAFPNEDIVNSFGEYIANLGARQLRIAETEKYPHVTFFFNGGKETQFRGEDRILINSPHVATYDLQPEMNAKLVTDKLVDAIYSGKYDAIICNFANADMVGHTGKLSATIQAIEILDICLGRITDAIQATHAEMLITADHGNAEQLCDYKTGDILTSHTTNPVPLVYFGEQNNIILKNGGNLSDLAPTLLDLMHFDKPSEMLGISLIESI